MFTGIIEDVGKVISLFPDNGNLHITMSASFTQELKIDQSISHNGACLTVTNIEGNNYNITAIAETLRKTNLGLLNTGDLINLERSMILNGRLDGHIVQGHVDNTAVCTGITEDDGSFLYHFKFEPDKQSILVSKGSICVNGVSLTIVAPGIDHFSVAIIPYTLENTNFRSIKKGSVVNLEFDLIGKYVAAYMAGK